MFQDFNYHTHTIRCGHADKNYKDESYVQEYIYNGFRKIAFTDHVPHEHKVDPRGGVRMDMSLKDEYLESINDLKEKYKGIIEIRTGFEVEYLPELEEEIKRRKEECDMLILGQHYIRNEKDELVICGRDVYTRDDFRRYADCIAYAADHKFIEIIGHPDFCLMKQPEFGQDEEEMAHNIGKIAEETGIPLEINLNRLFNATYYVKKVWNAHDMDIQRTRVNDAAYPSREFWKIISGYNAKIVWGQDVHTGGQISKHKELQELAEYKLGEEVISKLQFVKDL